MAILGLSPGALVPLSRCEQGMMVPSEEDVPQYVLFRPHSTRLGRSSGVSYLQKTPLRPSAGEAPV